MTRAGPSFGPQLPQPYQWQEDEHSATYRCCPPNDPSMHQLPTPCPSGARRTHHEHGRQLPHEHRVLACSFTTRQLRATYTYDSPNRAALPTRVTTTARTKLHYTNSHGTAISDTPTPHHPQPRDLPTTQLRPSVPGQGCPGAGATAQAVGGSPGPPALGVLWGPRRTPTAETTKSARVEALLRGQIVGLTHHLLLGALRRAVVSSMKTASVNIGNYLPPLATGDGFGRRLSCREP